MRITATYRTAVITLMVSCRTIRRSYAHISVRIDSSKEKTSSLGSSLRPMGTPLILNRARHSNEFEVEDKFVSKVNV